MTPAEAIAKYLRADATAVTALVSTRTYWPFATTEPTAPYVTVSLASTRRIAVSMNAALAPREYTVEVRCFGSTMTSAWAVADAVRGVLDNRTGATPATGGVTLKRCYCTDESEVIDDRLFTAGVFAVLQTYTVTT